MANPEGVKLLYIFNSSFGDKYIIVYLWQTALIYN